MKKQKRILIVVLLILQVVFTTCEDKQVARFQLPDWEDWPIINVID